jgi:hypothetical protein
MTKLAIGVAALSSLFVAACVEGPKLETVAAPAEAVLCGPADPATAARLDAQVDATLAGHLTGDALACARAIVETTRAYGLDERAAQIALATAIAQTSLVNVSAGGSDRAGLFGQHVSEGWGLPEQLVDPAFATSAFLDRMVTVFPEDEWHVQDLGTVAVRIEGSTPVDAVRAEADNARVMAAALWSPQVQTR